MFNRGDWVRITVLNENAVSEYRYFEVVEDYPGDGLLSVRDEAGKSSIVNLRAFTVEEVTAARRPTAR